MEEEESSRYVIKYSINKIFTSDDLKKKLSHALLIVDEIITETYHLLVLHILRLCKNNQSIPPLNRRYVRKFVDTISYKTNKQGRSVKQDEEIIKTKNDLYDKVRGPSKAQCRDYLKVPLDYALIEMETAITNNIKVHFIKRHFRYLKYLHPNIEYWDLKKLQDSLFTTKNPDVSYCLPESIERGVEYDLEKYPERFLLPMYRMNKTLEENGKRTFSLLPIRRGFIPSRYRHSI